MSRGYPFDRVYLDEVVTATPMYVTTNPDTGTDSAAYFEQLRKAHQAGDLAAAQKLWEWSEQQPPVEVDWQKLNDQVVEQMTRKLAEESGQPYRVDNGGRVVVDGCVLDQRAPAEPPVFLLNIGYPRDQFEVPLCLAGPKHPYRNLGHTA